MGVTILNSVMFINLPIWEKKQMKEMKSKRLSSVETRRVLKPCRMDKEISMKQPGVNKKNDAKILTALSFSMF